MREKENKTRRLTRDYLAAVDKVLLSLDRAKELRTALHRELAKDQGGNRGDRNATNSGTAANK